jgi:hypothetical protein
MADDVLLNKAASIERCIKRARDEYASEPDTFVQSLTRQDAAILNIQRACEAALDMGWAPGQWSNSDPLMSVQNLGRRTTNFSHSRALAQVQPNSITNQRISA